MQKDIFLGRQPILDIHKNIVAYELLFRSGQHAAANVTNDLEASTDVIASTISRLGLDNVIGNKLGFFNLSYEMLHSDIIELLPPDRVVLEILESVTIDDAVIERCRELKACGYKIALDDFEYKPVYDPLLEIVDLIKIDLLITRGQDLRAMINKIKHLPLKLLAEKVETEEEYHFCKSLGMEYFQGYFFARPVVLTSHRVDPEQTTLIKLLNQLMCEDEVDAIEKTFKTSPGLSLNLLRLVNSVGIGLRSSVNSIQRALVVIGRRQLLRWVQLLMYAKNNPSSSNPLLMLAAQRGMLMEGLAQALPVTVTQDTEFKDRAFMVGILSLVHVVMGVTMEDVLQQLPISQEIHLALLERKGQLGEMLTVVELVEQSAFDQVSKRIAGLGISKQLFDQAQARALQWAEGLGKEQ